MFNKKKEHKVWLHETELYYQKKKNSFAQKDFLGQLVLSDRFKVGRK